MDQQQTLSIIIPAYNEEKNILACLAAIFTQETHPYDIKSPNLENDCLEELASLGSEIYYLTKVGEDIKTGYKICKNFGVKYRADRRLIWAFL